MSITLIILAVRGYRPEASKALQPRSRSQFDAIPRNDERRR